MEKTKLKIDMKKSSAVKKDSLKKNSKMPKTYKLTNDLDELLAEELKEKIHLALYLRAGKCRQCNKKAKFVTLIEIKGDDIPFIGCDDHKEYKS